MKKLVTLLFAMATLFWVTDSFGQTEQGMWLFSGATDVTGFFGNTKVSIEPKDGDNTDFDGPKITAFEVTPALGYFIIDNVAVGLFAEVGYMKSDQAADEDVGIDKDVWSETSTIFGPFAQIFFGEGEVRPFIEGAVGFGTLKYKDESGGSDKSQSLESTTKIFGWEAGVGVSVFASESVSFEFGVGYGSEKGTNEVEDMGDIITTGSGVGVNIGISIFL